MIETRAPRSIALTAVLLTLIGTVGACGSATGTGPATPSRTPPSTSPSNTGTSSDTQTASVEGAQFRVSSEWTVKKEAAGIALRAPAGDYLKEGIKPHTPGAAVVGTVRPALGDTETSAGITMDQLKSDPTYSHAKRLPDVTYGGVRFYHVQAQTSESWYDEYGATYNSTSLKVDWDFSNVFIDRTGATKLINQVMPTFKPLP